MRIAVATRFAHRAGGVETYLESVLPALVERGHEVAVWHEFPVTAGAQVVVPVTMTQRPLASQPAGRSRAIEDIAAWRPDVTFSHGIADVALECRLPEAAPLLVMLHAYHGTCISGTKLHAFPNSAVCTRPLGPGCLAQFHVRRCGGLSPFSMLTSYAEQRHRQRLLQQCHGIVTLSEHMRRECVAQGVAAERVRVLTAFVPGGAASPSPVARTSPQPGERIHVVFAGRIEALKGAHLLIEALGLLPPAVLAQLRVTLAGDGRDIERCRALAAPLQAAGAPISLTGWQSPEACAAVMRTADLLVVPSIWPEPFGLVGLEAAALAVPALAFDVGGISEWLADGITGRLLDARPSAAALARGLEDCASDRERLLRWGAAARAAAERRTLSQHIDLLEAALTSASAGTGVIARSSH